MTLKKKGIAAISFQWIGYINTILALKKIIA